MSEHVEDKDSGMSNWTVYFLIKKFGKDSCAV